PKFAQEAVAKGELTEGQARPLVGSDQDFIRAILPRIIAEGWSARKVEQYMVNSRKNESAHKEDASGAVETQHEENIQALRKRLNTPVNIRVNSNGAGQRVIKFKDQDELERLQKLLGE